VKLEWVLDRLGLLKTLYYRWRQRRARGELEDVAPKPVDLYQATPEEEEAVKGFALSHPKDGYRRLAWMMVDQDVAHLSPSSVYRILDRNNLLSRWKARRSVGTKPEPPTAPHQRWHTDIMYLWVSGRWYFFIGVLDGYSRYIVHWELLASMRAEDVTLVILAALEKYPGVLPCLIHDNGTQFTSKEFRALIKQFSLKQIHIRIHHPQSNGKMERFHRTLRDEGLSDQEPENQLQARDIIAEWVTHYNQERLHAGLSYLTPEDWLAGRDKQRLEERQQKLETARKRRYQLNVKRQKEQSKPDPKPKQDPRREEFGQQGIDCQTTIGGFAPEPPGFTALSGAG
jgi:putative transposase